MRNLWHGDRKEEPLQDWALLMRVGGGLGESSYRFVSCRRHSNVCITQRGARVVEYKYVMLKIADPGGNRSWLCHCVGVDVSVHPDAH